MIQYSILNIESPIILYYGSKKNFSQDFEQITKWAKKEANSAIIDLKKYIDNDRAYYSILKYILDQII